MAIIDISGPVTTGMWRYGRPHLDLPVPPVSITQIDFPEPLKGQPVMEHLQMASQTGTYLETARHVYAERESIGAVPPERVWLVPTVVLHTPTDTRGKVTLDAVGRSLSQQRPGDR